MSQTYQDLEEEAMEQKTTRQLKQEIAVMVLDYLKTQDRVLPKVVEEYIEIINKFINDK